MPWRGCLPPRCQLGMAAWVRRMSLLAWPLPFTMVSVGFNRVYRRRRRTPIFRRRRFPVAFRRRRWRRRLAPADPPSTRLAAALSLVSGTNRTSWLAPTCWTPGNPPTRSDTRPLMTRTRETRLFPLARRVDVLRLRRVDPRLPEPTLDMRLARSWWGENSTKGCGCWRDPPAADETFPDLPT